MEACGFKLTSDEAIASWFRMLNTTTTTTILLARVGEYYGHAYNKEHSNSTCIVWKISCLLT